MASASAINNSSSAKAPANPEKSGRRRTFMAEHSCGMSGVAQQLPAALLSPRTPRSTIADADASAASGSRRICRKTTCRVKPVEAWNACEAPAHGPAVARTFDGDGGPYAASIGKVMGAFAANRSSAGAGPERLARALHDAATDGSAQVRHVRHVIGDDATALMQARHEIGEEALLVALRQRFGPAE
jgi:pyruvate/2-oxoglutarate dehydrogenase complex dihydrolipoamide acyltransferase (E2) component